MDATPRRAQSLSVRDFDARHHAECPGDRERSVFLRGGADEPVAGITRDRSCDLGWCLEDPFGADGKGATLNVFLISGLDHQLRHNDVLGELCDGDDQRCDIFSVDHAGLLFIRHLDGAFIEDGRIDFAGEDAGDADSAVAFLGIDGGGDGGNTEFRGCVAQSGERVGALTGDGGDAKNEAVFFLPHRGEGFVDEIEEAGAVDGHELVVVLVGEFGDLAFEDVDAGGVDQDIGDADVHEEILDLGAIGDVAGVGMDPVRCCILELLFVATTDRDLASGLGEGFGATETDAASAAGDDDSFSFQGVHLVKDGVKGIEGCFAENTGIVEATVLVEPGDGGHFFFTEDEFEEVDVLAEVVGRLGFRDRNGATLHGPAEGNLGGGAVVGLCDSFERWVGEESLGLGGHAEGEVGVRSEGREGRDGDVFFLTIADEGVLGEVGVDFDLKDFRLDAGVGENVAEGSGGEIAHADFFDESGIDQFFHGAPGVGVGNFDGAHGLATRGPAGRIHFLDGDVCERDGEVDEVEIEVIDAEVAQGFLASGADVLRFVVGVPELAGNPEILAGAETGFEGACDAFSD